VKLAVVLPILAVMVLLRLMRVGVLVWVVTWSVGMWVFLRYGFKTPIPDSAVHIYLGITALALFAYATSSRERAQEAFGPILEFATSPSYTLPLALVAALIPGLVAWGVYEGFKQPIQPPFFSRTVHPSPPTEITVHDQKIDLVKGENPFRALEKTDPKAFMQHVQNGRNVYYSNCFFCHGDSLAGDGMFAHAFDPVPANLKDSGVLPNFQETFFLWRVAKGGPGMPDEGAPGDSVMPEWERFLSNDQIWEVVLFLYADTGYRPRSWGEAVPTEAKP
jgi:mono/diheme cytochrome c family protein